MSGHYVETATLQEAPRTVDGQRVAKAILEESGQEVVARIVDPFGFQLPYQAGDVVRVELPMGTPDAGVFVVGLYGELTEAGVSDWNDGHSRIANRNSNDIRLLAPGGLVRMGRDDGGTYQKVMLHPQASEDIENLQRQIDYLVSLLNTCVAGIHSSIITFNLPSSGGPATTAMQALMPGYAPSVATIPPADTAEGRDPAVNAEAEKDVQLVIP